MGYGRFIGRIGNSAESGGLEKVMDHERSRNKRECVEKYFSCFRDVKFGSRDNDVMCRQYSP